MTPAAVLPVNTAVNANASASHTSSTRNAPGRFERSDFRKPLLQARQQQQQAPSSQQAPASSDDKTAAKASDADGQAHTDAQDKPDKDAATASTPVPDPASAMLALLGQSIPAQAAAAPAADASGQGDAVASPIATTLPAGMPAMENAPMASGPQVDAADTLDSKAAGVLKDNALDTASAPAGDSDEAPATNFADALAAWGKTPNAGHDPQPASNDRSNTLDALNSLMSSPLPQAQPAAQATPPPHALAMQSTVGTPAFAQELGQQVAWLGGQDIKEARIRLHPEDLGPLDVRVSVKQDHVDVSFIAQHPQAVHAVQQTLGQLDTLLAHHGLSLGHAEVGQGSRGNESGQGASSGAARANTDDSQESSGLAAVAAPVIKAIGLLDTFA